MTTEITTAAVDQVRASASKATQQQQFNLYRHFRAAADHEVAPPAWRGSPMNQATIEAIRDLLREMSGGWVGRA